MILLSLSSPSATLVDLQVIEALCVRSAFGRKTSLFVSSCVKLVRIEMAVCTRSTEAVFSSSRSPPEVGVLLALHQDQGRTCVWTGLHIKQTEEEQSSSSRVAEERVTNNFSMLSVKIR